MAASFPCPCGGAQTYAICCEPFHRGVQLPDSAEQLMRSRYSAFHQGKIDYLMATRHPSLRKPQDREKIARTLSNTEWVRLQILSTARGQADDEAGQVEFVATYLESGEAKRLHERSQFTREEGRWYYVTGEYENLLPLPKPGRNEPCWCGSGKKSKKCHGR